LVFSALGLDIANLLYVGTLQALMESVPR